MIFTTNKNNEFYMEMDGDPIISAPSGELTSKVFILSFTRWHPFAGCTYMKELILFGNTIGIVPVVFTPKKGLLSRLFMNIGEDLTEELYDQRLREVSEVDVLELGTLDDIPIEHRGSMYAALVKLDLDYHAAWTCPVCGELVNEPPEYETGTASFGGTEYHATGYACAACANPCPHCGEPRFNEPLCECGKDSIRTFFTYIGDGAIELLGREFDDVTFTSVSGIPYARANIEALIPGRYYGEISMDKNAIVRLL